MKKKNGLRNAPGVVRSFPLIHAHRRKCCYIQNRQIGDNYLYHIHIYVEKGRTTRRKTLQVILPHKSILLFVQFLMLHAAYFAGQTKEVDKALCIVMVIQITCSERSYALIIQ